MRGPILRSNISEKNPNPIAGKDKTISTAHDPPQMETYSSMVFPLVSGQKMPYVIRPALHEASVCQRSNPSLGRRCSYIHVCASDWEVIVKAIVSTLGLVAKRAR